MIYRVLIAEILFLMVFLILDVRRFFVATVIYLTTFCLSGWIVTKVTGI